MNESQQRDWRPDVSIVVPAHNEESNVGILLDQFGELSQKARFSLEVVMVDDGSTDQTMPRLVDAQRKYRFVRIISLPYRRGLTEALRAGFSVARGTIVVFYPADRQFHPADIPRLVEKVRSGYDLVTGRKIGQYSKRFVSSFYNRLSRWLFPSIQVSDLNSVKAFRRELIDVFDYRHDWHRFWVAIASELGFRIGEVDVTLYERPSGRSKFGFWRIPAGVLDLLAVKFQYHTMRRPLWYFGLTGSMMLTLSFLVGLVALYNRFVLQSGNRALALLVMALGLAGIMLFALGFLAEAISGIRQQVEALRSTPKYQVFKPPTADGRPGRSDRPPRDSRGAPDRRRPHDTRQTGRAPQRSRPPSEQRAANDRAAPAVVKPDEPQAASSAVSPSPSLDRPERARAGEDAREREGPASRTVDSARPRNDESALAPDDSIQTGGNLYGRRRR